MTEVVSKTGESLPNNFEKITSSPNAFLIYLKTQLAAFAKVLDYYERDVLITELSESQVVVDVIISAARKNLKPVLVRDSNAKDEEVQKAFHVTKEQLEAMKAEVDDFDFESLREETADCYLDLETFATEFGEKMCAIIKELEARLILGARPCIRDQWINDPRLPDLVTFIEQLAGDRLDDADDIKPYRPVIEYFYNLPLGKAIDGLGLVLRIAQDDEVMSMDDDNAESVVASKLDELFDDEDEDLY